MQRVRHYEPPIFFLLQKKKKKNHVNINPATRGFKKKNIRDRTRSYAFVSVVSIKIADGPAECRISS